MFLEDADKLSESSGSESVFDRQKRSSQHLVSPTVSIDLGSGGKLMPSAISPNKTSERHRFVGTVDVSWSQVIHDFI